MRGGDAIPLQDLIDGLESVLNRTDLTDQERTALERAVSLIKND